MPRDGTQTRTRLLDAAQELILSRGFAGTTVDDVLRATGLAKGAFFHHFASKADLARAVIQRFADRDRELADTLVERAERLGHDPVQQLLLVVGFMEEMAEELTDPDHGCLFAAYAYESQLFDVDVHAIIRKSFLHWRQLLAEKVRAAIRHRRPVVSVSAVEVADMLNVVVEGAYVLGKSTTDPGMLARQLKHYRTYLEMLFGVPAHAARRRRSRATA
jgi:TetR/AcrR family transcriptional repressor of nem operon